MFRTVTVLLIGAMLAFAPAVAEATLLTNVTTGATIFADDYEQGTVGSAPSDPYVGSWQVVAGNPVVTNAATSGVPAHEGNQFLSLGSTSLERKLSGSGVSANSGNGNEVVLDTYFYVASGGDNTARVAPMSGATQLAYIAFWGQDPWGTAATRVTVEDWQGNWLVLGQPFARDSWCHVVVNHTNGANLWSISVNDQTPSTWAPATSGNWDGLVLGGSGAYFDASNSLVPEPSAIALLATGLISLLAYAWRKRR